MTAVRGEAIRVRGLVQGVGFRPTVWRLAREQSLGGDVRNDGDGVLIRLWGEAADIEAFCGRLQVECPPLGRIDSLQRSPLAEAPPDTEFSIVASTATEIHTGVVADAATCGACRTEIFNPDDRRYRYPFTNCTHCGPRLSIVQRIPYDRANTSMAVFPLCPRCRVEYTDPADRRFHAQPTACPECGPKLWLSDTRGKSVSTSGDALQAADDLLRTGHILSIKGIGGFHLACDAGNAQAVRELRRRKRRYGKPFALMARDVGVIRRYCRLGRQESELLASPAAPILLLDLREDAPALVAPEVAPGQSTLGFMLPYSPLHLLLLSNWERPLVMTSGNLSEEPQCTDNRDAEIRLQGLADYHLLHDRAVVNRVDDSVLRVMDGAPRFLRRARGYAPAPMPLPPGFERSPQILALGGELKNTLCLVKDGQAILSQHLGDLEDARTAEDYRRSIDLYGKLFQHAAELLVVDLHPDYRSTLIGHELAAARGIRSLSVQHHFAHIAGVLADNARPLQAGPVLGIALDGLGYGTDGSIWGGEFLQLDYRGFERLAHLKPVPLPGGTKAILEPWRNAYAQLAVHLGWEAFATAYPDLDITRYLEQKPLQVLHPMVQRGLNSPLSSSCGRLFDAVAAVLGVSREQLHYEGQAAIELEALAVSADDDGTAYSFGIEGVPGEILLLDPKPMWQALLRDLASGINTGRVARRFHAGLALAVSGSARDLAVRRGLDTVALSGGVFQNRLLLERVCAELRGHGLLVLQHRRVPSNDGGLALGQAVVAAAAEL